MDEIYSSEDIKKYIRIAGELGGIDSNIIWWSEMPTFGKYAREGMNDLYTKAVKVPEELRDELFREKLSLLEETIKTFKDVNSP